MWPDSDGQSCGQARPPCRGAVRDYGREEMIRQQRLSERVHRLAQLCCPGPDATVSTRTAAPLGTKPGPPNRSRSPPLPGVGQRPPRALQAATHQLPQPSVDPAVLPAQSLAISDRALAAGRAAPQAIEGYAELLSICSTYLDLLAQQYAQRTQPHVPRPNSLSQAGSRLQDLAVDLVAQVELACRCHDEEHDTTHAIRLQQDLGHMYCARALVRQLVAPTLGPPTRADSPLPGDAAPPAPGSPDSSTIACPKAEAMPVSPPRPTSPARLHGPDPAGHATPSPCSSGRSPTLSPYAACRRAGMGTHRIAVYREPGASPPHSPSSSLGSS